MQSVPSPAWGLSHWAARGRRRWVLLAALFLVATAAAIALTRPGSPAPAPAAPAAAPPTAAGLALINGKPLQKADCTDWSAASSVERAGAVAALRRNVGGATGVGRSSGVTIPDTEAVALFDRACAGPIARHWLLYILYTRAAGFQSLKPQT